MGFMVIITLSKDRQLGIEDIGIGDGMGDRRH